MTFEITVNGKPYEMNIGFRELINDGRTSVSMSDADMEEVAEAIREMFIDAALNALHLVKHNKNYTKDQFERIDDLRTFLYGVEHGQFSDYCHRNGIEEV